MRNLIEVKRDMYAVYKEDSGDFHSSRILYAFIDKDSDGEEDIFHLDEDIECINKCDKVENISNFVGFVYEKHTQGFLNETFKGRV